MAASEEELYQDYILDHHEEQKCCLLSWRVLQAAIYSPANGQAAPADQPASAEEAS